MRFLSVACVLVGSVFASALVSTGTQAQPQLVVTGPRDPDVRSQWVSYRDLNLTNAAGQRTFARRVKSAVTQVCRVNGDYDSEFQCRRSSWQDARPKIALAIRSKMAVAAAGEPLIMVAAR